MKIVCLSLDSLKDYQDQKKMSTTLMIQEASN